jgi:enoyl-CoA hydratase/carnithine racemase
VARGRVGLAVGVSNSAEPASDALERPRFARNVQERLRDPQLQLPREPDRARHQHPRHLFVHGLAGRHLHVHKVLELPRGAKYRVNASLDPSSSSAETITVAAVNGAAAGVGLVAACYCDLRFASEDAKLTAAHGPLGLPPEFGLSWLLPRMIGLTRANDLLLSSRIFLASETVDWGLFNAVVPRDQLMDTVMDYTNRLLSRVAPSSLKATKRHVYLDQHRDVGTAVAEADADIERLMREPDYKEGVAAFIERRPAVWPDRI